MSRSLLKAEVGNEGDEVSYPVISVVWDDSITEWPDEYIGKCIEAFERFEGLALLLLRRDPAPLDERIGACCHGVAR